MADDLAYFWLGDKAVSSFTQGNADIASGYHTQEKNIAKTFTAVVEADSMTPVRVIQLNSLAFYWLKFSVKDSAGNVLISTLKATTDGQFVTCQL